MSAAVSPLGTGYWSLYEVADYLSLSTSTIRRKMNQGGKYFDSSFPRPRHIGKLVRFLIFEIVAWAESQ